MTFEQTITDMSQLADIAYLPYGASINVGDVYYQNVTLSDANGNLKSYYLTSKYTVIDYDNNFKGNGMEAVLLRNETTGQFVIAFRGTQEPLDGIYDVTTGFFNYNPQIPDAMAFVNDMIDKYGSSEGLSKSNLTLTGHSLGGILTQSVGATMQIQGYTFNAWSSSNLIDYSNYLLDPLGLIHRVAALLGWGAEATVFAERNILNLSYTDSGMFNGDPLSNILSGILGLNEFLGTVLPIFGADLSLIDGHRMPNMITAINHYNILLNHFDNKDFLVLTMAYVLSDLMGTNQFYEKGEQFFKEAGVYSIDANHLSFNFLDDLSAYELAQQAESDRAVLFALLKLNGFAVEGNLGGYSVLNLADYSSMYIQDRSLLLFHMLDPVARPVGDHYFEDMGYDFNLGSSGSFDGNPAIKFGTDSMESIAGNNEEDHLYGMGGADGLNGNGGDDWIEGGEGADILDGGAGKDVLIGGYTKDKVDAQSDMLKGGTDFDTYISGNTNIISDSDGKGRVYFEGKLLTGGTKPAGSGCEPTEDNGDSLYYGDGGIYRLSGNTLTFLKDGKILTIEDYTNTQLHITLNDNPGDGGSCPSSGPGGGGSGRCPPPINPLFSFSFSLPSVTSINQTQSVSKYMRLAA